MQQNPALSSEELIDHNRDWFEAQVLAACCRSAAYFKKFRSHICVHPRDPRMVQEDFSFPVDNLIYRVVRQYRDMVAGNSGMDSVPAGFVHITLQAMAAVNDIPADQVDFAVQRFQQIAAQPVESVLPILDQHTGYWISKRRIHILMLRLSADEKQWKPEDVTREMHLAQEAQRSAAGGNYAHRFGDGWKRSELNVQRILTGIRRFDAVVGGGLGFREGALFIAPTGGGKTVAACQLATQFALTGHEGILISTEQPHYELEPRIVSNACKIPFDLIKDGLDLEKMSAEKTELVRKLGEELSARLTIYDWAGKGKSVATDLREEIRTYREKRGRNPQFLIFDWIGGGMGQISEKQLAFYRLLFQQTADEIVNVAEQENLVACSFIQANTTQSKNNNRIGPECIAECKSAGQKYTTIVGISALQEGVENMEQNAAPAYMEKQFWFISKARKGTGGLVPVKRNFAFQRFENWN